VELTTAGGKLSVASKGHEVHGYVIYQARRGRRSTEKRTVDLPEVFLPDFEVFLKNVATGEVSPTVVSNLFGMFRFPPQKRGLYELCWRAQGGWDAGVLASRVEIRDHVQYPGTVLVQPRKGFVVATGIVKLADGGSPWFRDEFFDVTRTATVTALDGRGLAMSEEVRTNYRGEYAIAGLPLRSPVKLRAMSEGASAGVSLAAQTVSQPALPVFSEIILKNHRPRVSAVVATLDGQPVTAAPPGSVLKVAAVTEDENGDSLAFDWRTPAGSVAGQGAEAEWTLPKAPGIFELVVLVSDGHGGDATGRLTIGLGAKGVVFSGQVVNPAGKPVPGAVVRLGNQPPVRTSKTGAFRLTTKPDTQYVLNIKAPGFALLSRLTASPLPHQVYQLVPAQVEKFDADKDLELTDRRPELERKKSRGASIRLPAGALVDDAGRKVAGPIQAEIATLDIANNEMPGDFLGTANGQDVGLISYGAVHVEFTDATGKPCQLGPGLTAEATIPIPAAMLAQAAPTIPVWSYDPADGRWKNSGSAALDKPAGVYRGKVSHFSTINMDQPGPVSCIRVHTDVSLPAGLTLRVRDVPGEGVEFSQQKETVLDGEQSLTDGPLNAVFRIPADTRVEFRFKDRTGASLDDVIIVEDGDRRLQPPVPLAGNRVTAGPASADLWPAYPYTGCKDVTIKLKTLWSGYPNSPFFSFKGDGSLTEATSYYATVDPGGSRTNLLLWFGANGFNAAGEAPGNPDYVRTSYLNDNDLGSGRDMHFLKHPDGTLSAYVTNYNRGVSFDQRLAFANDARDRVQPGATVCMEYKPVNDALPPSPTNVPVVKFFVFADLDGLPGVERQAAANLDGFGAKFVPNLCLNCHGGNYNPGVADMGANFRELDLATYLFPDGRTTANAAEQGRFRQQNLMIRDLAANPIANSNPVTRGPIHDLISGWYATGGNQDNNYTPAPDWGVSPQRDLYHNVVKVSCRTCHIAFDSNNDSGGIDWNRYDQLVRQVSGRGFNFIEGYAVGTSLSGTGSGRIMPHALVTYRNFWLNKTPVHRPAFLWNYSDGTRWPQIGQPPP
jgi:hypothetical protein